jgi:5'-nucleotidase
MNILVSNDDGYQSVGIIRLAAALRAHGHRTLIVAPDSERSGYSHATSLSAGYIDIKQIDAGAWICGGTPVDCVMAAIAGGVDFDIDLVASGINAGCNLGTDILFSGTAAAAREAALYGRKAVAFSLAGSPPYFWDTAAEWAASHIEALAALWHEGNFVNVNMPNLPALPDEPLFTFPSKRRYVDTASKELTDAGWLRLRFDDVLIETVYEAGSDTDAVDRGRVSVGLVHVEPLKWESPHQKDR